MVGALRSSVPPKDNLTKSERAAIKSLKSDENIVILLADKGRCTVVLDLTDYEAKAKQLLDDTDTYQKLKKDPTKKFKNQLLEVLKRLKREGKLDSSTYFKLYPTSETVPKFYGLPKIHKEDCPLRPIVSSIGSITYATAKFLASILSPLVGHTEHFVKDSSHFVETLKDVTVEPNETLVSFDVTALFTSVPTDEAIKVIKERLECDPTLRERTNLDPQDIVQLLDVVLNTTYFQFRGEVYQQCHGAAMGSPVSPIVANLKSWPYP